MSERFDIAIIGAGAAGLMAAIAAGRQAPDPRAPPRVILLDGAKHIGAKILVAGGGRCNVTHDVVNETAYAGSSRNAIRKVLLGFDVQRTIDFFREIGVELKREETCKLFPVTDEARTVLDALLREVKRVGVTIRHPWRVQSVRKERDGFVIESTSASESIEARRVILATGGKSLPKTGSDGGGYELARSLGHAITERVFPALVPLLLPKNHPLCALSGIAVDAKLEVRTGTDRRLSAFTGSTLCTHFGLSGPGPLDISRYLIDARFDDRDAYLVINWLPQESPESFDRVLVEQGRSKHACSAGRILREHNLPARLADALCAIAGIEASASLNALTREHRRAMTNATTSLTVPIIGDRGFAHAEVTAGGVPLSEVRLDSMESRITPALYVIGEICDVDGRIGGYNFQWAWSSGHLAGRACAASLQ